MLPPFCLSQTTNRHYTYNDALQLAALFKQDLQTSNDNMMIYEKYYSILKKYGIDDNNLEMNPFLKQYILKPKKVAATIPDTATKISKDNNIVNNRSTLPKEASMPIASSLNWQASAISGIATFMAGRFKQEVLHMGINQLFKNIKERESVELVSAFFPRTFLQIETLYGEGHNSYYTADLVYLRQLAESDYAHLPDTMISKMDLIFPKLKNYPNSSDMLKLGNMIYKKARDGNNITEIIPLLANGSFETGSQVRKMMDLMDLLSTALSDTLNSNQYWVNPNRLALQQVDDQIHPEIQLFYGLLYQQFIADPVMNPYLDQFKYDIQLLSQQMQKLTGFVSTLNATYDYLKKRSFQLYSKEDQIFYLKEVYGAIKLFAETEFVKKQMQIGSDKLEICENYLNIVEAVINKEYDKAIPIITIELGKYMNISYSRDLTFVAQLVTLQNGDDMEKLLNAYALPIGSASIKRHSRFNWSINGYVGLTLGNETAFGKSISQGKTNIGMTAPIGLSYTFGAGKENHFTLFASFIDLGSMVNARLGNDTSSYSNLRFEHFLSPGLGIFYNWENIPISMGLQYAYIPNLRNIQYEKGTATITETGVSVSRFNFSVLVDIPFFTIYNKDSKDK